MQAEPERRNKKSHTQIQTIWNIGALLFRLNVSFFKTKTKNSFVIFIFLIYEMVQLQAFGYHFHFERKEMVKGKYRERYTSGANQVNANNNLQASTATVPCVIYHSKHLFIFYTFASFFILYYFIYVFIFRLLFGIANGDVGAHFAHFSHTHTHRKYRVNHCRSMCRSDNANENCVLCTCAECWMLKDIWIYLL